MKTTRVAALAAFLTGASVGLATPASAELLGGTYTAVLGTGRTTTQTWVFTPCGPGCAHLDTGTGPTREMHLQGNTWSALPFGDRNECSTTIDNASLSGTAGCSFMQFPVQLTKVG
jgi:hypothetical protein